MDYTAFATSLLEANTYGKIHGIRLVSISEDDIETSLEVKDEMKNPYGMVHGGLMFMLADSTSGMLCRIDGRRYVTLNADIRYLQSGKSGIITSKAHIVRRGKSTAVVAADVIGEDGTLLSQATFTMYCLDQNKKPFASEE